MNIYLLSFTQLNCVLKDRLLRHLRFFENWTGAWCNFFASLRTAWSRSSTRWDTQQIGRRDEKASENPFTHIKNTAYTHSCAQTDTLWGHSNVSVTGHWSHCDSNTHTHIQSLTTHGCPLITTTFHGHCDSFSPYLLHTPVLHASLSASPYSSHHGSHPSLPRFHMFSTSSRSPIRFFHTIFFPQFPLLHISI